MMLLRHALPGSLHLYTTHQTMTSRKRIPPQKAKKIKRKMSCGVIMELSVVFARMCCMYAAPGGTMLVLRMVRQGAPYACCCHFSV